MPKSFEELMAGANKVLTGIQSSTGARKQKPVALNQTTVWPNSKPKTKSPGWREEKQPEPISQHLAFTPRGSLSNKEILIHLFDPDATKEELEAKAATVRAELFWKHRVVIHGHEATRPCFTPDGCYEVG